MTHVEIVMIIPTAPTQRHNARGVSLDFNAIGRRLFIVDLIEADGCRCAMWDGESYEKAIVEAEELAADFKCGVVDLVSA